MKNKVLNEIAESAKKKLNAEYGYCGVAVSDNMVVITSTDHAGKSIKIEIVASDE